MSATKCPLCKKDKSRLSEYCPSCTSNIEKNKKNSPAEVIVILLLVAGVWWYMSGDSAPEVPESPKTAAEIRVEKVGKAFNSWDGSHRKLEQLVKQSLKDPDSYEHVETRFADKTEYIQVQLKYRARNGFGGWVVETVTAKCALSGDVLQILSRS